MKPRFSFTRAGTISLVLFLLALVAQGTPAPAEDDQSKILAGYFEEWSIYGANYNIANLQQNHVANRITHLIMPLET